jgi:DNA-binding NarL/FixJ family response regulator
MNRRQKNISASPKSPEDLVTEALRESGQDRLATDDEIREWRSQRIRIHPASMRTAKQTQPAPTTETKPLTVEVLDQLLKAKGWAKNFWATQAEVDFNTIKNYMNRKTKKLNPSSRKKMADAIGIPLEQLPPTFRNSPK